MMCKRGDVYYVDFGHNKESCVQCGIRPALVVSNNRANESSPVITVIPLTARTYKRRSIPTHVLVPKKLWQRSVEEQYGISGAGQHHRQIRLLDKKGTVTSAQVMAAITRALQIQIGAVEKYN